MTYPIYEAVAATDISGAYIKRTDEDGRIFSIPTDPANSDYQAYLAYVANGNKVPSNSSTPQAGE